VQDVRVKLIYRFWSSPLPLSCSVVLNKDHALHLQQVMEILQQHSLNFFVKLPKCSFAGNSFEYLLWSYISAVQFL